MALAKLVMHGSQPSHQNQAQIPPKMPTRAQQLAQQPPPRDPTLSVVAPAPGIVAEKDNRSNLELADTINQLKASVRSTVPPKAEPQGQHHTSSQGIPTANSGGPRPQPAVTTSSLADELAAERLLRQELERRMVEVTLASQTA